MSAVHVGTGTGTGTVGSCLSQVQQGQHILVTACKPNPELPEDKRPDQAYKRVIDGKIGFALPGQAKAMRRYIDASQGPELWEQPVYYVLEVTYEGKSIWKGRMIGQVQQIPGQNETC
jgi:hypothetical protein